MEYNDIETSGETFCVKKIFRRDINESTRTYCRL